MKSRGQAMIEFAVTAASLSLLLLGLPVIARLHTLQLATVEVARTSAFVNAWHAAAGAGSGAAQPNAAMSEEAASGDQAGIREYAVHWSNSAPSAVAAQSGALMLAPFMPLQRAGGGFDLRNTGVSGAQIDARVEFPESTPEPFVGMSIGFQESYQLLGNTWSSAGPAQVAARSGGLVLSRAADSVHGIMAFGTSLLALVEPAFRRYCSGSVDPEIVPADRLQAYKFDDSQPARPTAWRASC